MSRTDAEVVAALRAGDEAAFAELIRAQHSLLHRTAMTYVSSRAVADEVVQETWLGVLTGLEGFEGRSSLRTWIFRIAANIARKRAVREVRCRPFSSMPAARGPGGRLPGRRSGWALAGMGDARAAAAVARDPGRHPRRDRARCRRRSGSW